MRETEERARAWSATAGGSRWCGSWRPERFAESGVRRRAATGVGGPMPATLERKEKAMATRTWDAWNYRESAEVSSRGKDLTGSPWRPSTARSARSTRSTLDVGSSYVVVDTGPWIFGRKVMLPAGTIDRVDWNEEKVYVDRTKDQIKDSPELDESDHVRRRGVPRPPGHVLRRHVRPRHPLRQPAPAVGHRSPGGEETLATGALPCVTARRGPRLRRRGEDDLGPRRAGQPAAAGLGVGVLRGEERLRRRATGDGAAGGGGASAHSAQRGSVVVGVCTVASFARGGRGRRCAEPPLHHVVFG